MDSWRCVLSVFWEQTMDNDFIQWPAALFLRNSNDNTVIKFILFSIMMYIDY